MSPFQRRHDIQASFKLQLRTLNCLTEIPTSELLTYVGNHIVRCYIPSQLGPACVLELAQHQNSAAFLLGLESEIQVTK